MVAVTNGNQRTAARWLVPFVLIAPVLLIFAPVLFADRSFAFRDGAQFYHPLFQWIAGEWGAGRVPLWNPQENCGLPALADATSSIFYPAKLVFALPMPFAWLDKFYVIGHVLLASAGMYCLARRLRASEPSAALVAIAYSLGGNVLFQYCNIVFLVGAAWLPAALLAVEEIASSRCWRAMLFLAFVLAMMILGGDPQMAYHVLMAGGLRLIFAWRSHFLSTVYRTEGTAALLLAGAALLAFLLSAVQILPSSEATKTSERAAYNRPRNIYEAAAVLANSSEKPALLDETPGEKITAGLFGQPEAGTHHDRAYDFSISPWRAIEFVWPNIGGRAFPENQRWLSRVPGESKPWTPSMYLGLLPVLAGAIAFRLLKGDVTTRWLSWLVLIFAVGSLGWYGFGWLIRECYSSLLGGDSSKLAIGAPVGGLYWLMVTLLPTYVYFRYPAKLMVVAVCALLTLAAPSADRLFTQRSERWQRSLKYLAGFSLLLAFGVWCASPYLLTIPPTQSQVFGPFNTSGALFDVIRGLLHTAVVAGLIHWIVKQAWDALDSKEDPENLARWKWAAAGLTAVELVVANAWLIFSAPATIWEDTAPVAAAIRQHEQSLPRAERIGQPRFFRGSYFAWHAPSFAKASSPQRMEEIVRWDHDTLAHKYHLPSGLQLIESYGSLKPVDYESLLYQARQMSGLQVDGAAVPLGAALRVTACEYLVLPAAAEVPFAERIIPPETIELPENVSLWRMKRPMPRAWVVHQVVQLPPLASSRDIRAVDQRSREVLVERREGKEAARDFRRLAVVETAGPLPAELLGAGETVPASEAILLIDSPQHVQIQLKIHRPGLLVLADSFNPGWQATIQPSGIESGAVPQPATVHRTNRCFRGVALPAGQWLVDFHYRPSSFFRGALLSSVSWFGLIMAGISGWFHRRC